MSLASTSCYWPNGQLVTEYNYQPCNAGSDSKHAACCDLRTSVCTEYGYCIGNANYIYRGGCTDSTWLSSSCAQACSFQVEANISNFANILNCDSGVASATQDQTWCCAVDGSSCCDSSFAVAFGRPYFPTSSTSTVASTSTTVSSSGTEKTSATTATTGPAAPTTPSTNNRTDTRSIGIGVGVGVGVGALVVGIMAFWFVRERKRRVTAEQRFQAMAAVGGHDPSFIAKPELEQPSHDHARIPYSRMHEANSQSLYEVQG
ncbi:hypothetical protein Z517_06879 [Fonsecaea pedrosoi CBS 271.37]|uniref:Unplaced genomic scaffold supercont1.4, whole genome shotgun sequence n=1 Tax=Fonsecaea pedrosoi CBS 271.37 TaxID=1442368 RepID=A0A0D2H6G1_9EURO|nr:uncharacterized protein Z517_06879 [Fonsecaea pedrosoi CBS 271.37]KIW80264.1 hypothetical protein Z517_06879 [Fonsecaea pedrosoi CBS 271.37]